MNKQKDKHIKTKNAYDYIYSKINQGEILSGETLTERNIAKMLNMSRTPVREAFRKLEQDGIVTFEPYKGVRVISYTKEKVEQLYSVRTALEVLSIEVCVKKENAVLVNTLNNLLKNAEQAVFHQDIIKLREINSLFHSEIANFTNNPYLISNLKNLQTKIDMLMTKSLSNRGRPQQNIEEHQLIVWAIQEKNVNLAKSLVEHHIKKSLENVLKNVEDE